MVVQTITPTLWRSKHGVQEFKANFMGPLHQKTIPSCSQRETTTWEVFNTLLLAVTGVKLLSYKVTRLYCFPAAAAQLIQEERTILIR